MIYVLIAIVNGWIAGVALADHSVVRTFFLIVYGLVQYWLGQSVTRNSLTRRRLND